MTTQIYSIGDVKSDLLSVSRMFHSSDTLGGINSRHIRSLEDKFKTITGKNSTFVNSCTNGIYLSLKEIDINGKLVVVSPITFFGVAGAILKCGGIPVYCEVDEYGLATVDSIQELVDSDSVGAILPSHINNRYVPLDGVESNVDIIEDSAAAWGIKKDNGAHLVTDSKNTSVISFSYGKPLCAGEGGMVFNNHDRLKEQRFCGLEMNGGTYGYDQFDVVDPELKFANSALSAALVSLKLKRYEQDIQASYTIAKHYDSEFGNHIESRLNHNGNHQTFVILSDKSDQIIQALSDNDIRSYKSHRPLFWNSAFSGFKSTKKIIDSAENYYKKIVHIPCRGDLTDSEVNKISETIKSVLL